jgi:hypothetical protein
MSTDVQIPGAKGILVDTTGAEIIAEDSPAVSDSNLGYTYGNLIQ